ncbi:SCO family protein [Lysobacter solisilvae (ex Woo and Kim 2020)]|uniref:SCO family protein n=1 Tax=Agrilutibacter terrestris TaxID=2865112 RepID=A0A7H0FWK8_9GAMM|nr:SCO family protein [Lysobacter terrestris]QNP40424.1 SCO family protein [Lysobacter terrestris]
MKKSFRALLFAVLAGLAFTLLSAAALAADSAPKPAPLPRDSVYQLPLRLTDQSAQVWDWRTRRGRPQLVSMFYTSCQYICPLIVDSGKAIDHNLTPAQRARLRVLLISMDPAHDTPAALQSIVDKRRLDPQRWTLAAPPAADVRAVAGVLGIRYRALADGNFNHTSALVLLDADGRILARTEQVGSRPDPEFLAAVRKATTP